MLLKVVTDIFQVVGKDVGPFGEKKFFWKFFSPKSPKPRMCPKGTTAAFGTSLWTAPKANFFPESFSYTLFMWRALKSCYGHFPSGREGYRTILRKKKFLEIFFPFKSPKPRRMFPKGSAKSCGVPLWKKCLQKKFFSP